MTEDKFTVAMYIRIDVANRSELNEWAKKAWNILEDLGAIRVWWHGICAVGDSKTGHKELFQLNEDEQEV